MSFGGRETQDSRGKGSESSESRNSSVCFDTEDELSVPSHDKTPLPKYRENPAIHIQELMSNVSSPKYQGLLAKSVSLSRRYSTEGCEHYKEALEKVKLLMEHLSLIIQHTMPAHVSEALKKTQNATAEVLLIRGIMAAGRENYEKAIKVFKEALIACNTASVKSRELRVSALHQIGISLCLMNEFAEAERYYQFALDEFTKDEQLVTNSVSTYTRLAASTGEGFAENLPIDKYLSKMLVIDKSSRQLNRNTANNLSLLPNSQDGQSENIPLEPSRKEDEQPKDENAAERSDLKWFPQSKEELLDYSAAYIQMMVMGAEMVSHQEEIRVYHKLDATTIDD